MANVVWTFHRGNFRVYLVYIDNNGLVLF